MSEAADAPDAPFGLIADAGATSWVPIAATAVAAALTVLWLAQWGGLTDQLRSLFNEPPVSPRADDVLRAERDAGGQQAGAMRGGGVVGALAELQVSGARPGLRDGKNAAASCSQGGDEFIDTHLLRQFSLVEQRALVTLFRNDTATSEASAMEFCRKGLRPSPTRDFPGVQPCLPLQATLRARGGASTRSRGAPRAWARRAPCARATRCAACRASGARRTRSGGRPRWRTCAWSSRSRARRWRSRCRRAEGSRAEGPHTCFGPRPSTHTTSRAHTTWYL